MHFKIHRGSSEIGGTCIEVWTNKARLVIDFGLPLMNVDKTPFDTKVYKQLNHHSLIKEKILPDIPGLYGDGVPVHILLSHAHQDHYGLMTHLHPDCPVHMGVPTYDLINITNIFTGNQKEILNRKCFWPGQSFWIGDIYITPFLMDHSAYNSHAFLLESNGVRIFYTGDFRAHGRKRWTLDNLKSKIGQPVDYLLLEGTSIGRNMEKYPSETDLELRFIEEFSSKNGIHLVYTSGQNIDRIITILRACKQTGRILAVDFYVANVLAELARTNSKIPYPNRNTKELKVFYPKYLSNRFRDRKEEFMFPFVSSKISKFDFNQIPGKLVMLVRPSMMYDLKFLTCLEDGNFIYSMWHGYKSDKSVSKLIDFVKSKGMTMVDIHTSGHADIAAMKQMIKITNPKTIVPIHTNEPELYITLFPDENVQLITESP